MIHDVETRKRVTLPIVSKEFGKEASKAKVDLSDTGRFQRIAVPEDSGTSRVILDDKYVLMNEVGRGAMGMVFMAEDMRLKRKVAIKFLIPSLASIPEYAQRFHNEAVGMASIQNPNVAQIFSFGEYDNVPFFVMEYLEGMTVEYLIDTHFRRNTFIPLADGIEILIQALNGLAAIHRAEAVHRDIKPGNIMITHDPVRAVITDFGMVRMVKMKDDVRALAGTPAYMAPETLDGESDANRSHLVDIYSMGVSAYEIFTGMIPFDGDNWTQILNKHVCETALLPSERRPGIPDELDDIVMKAMSKNPADRYQSCEEFLSDLYEVQRMRFSQEPRSIKPFKSDPPNKKPVPTPRSRRRSGQKRFARSSPSAGEIHIVVADPDSQFRTIIHGTAKKITPDCRISSAADGAEALELVEKLNPKILVLSLSLPKINAYEIAAILRGDMKHKDMEIIVAADAKKKKEKTYFKILGVKTFIDKKSSVDTLTATLRPILESLTENSG